MTDPGAHEIHARDIRRRRSLVAETFIRMCGRTGAVIGTAWVLITAFFAAWAPFLANSRPLICKTTDPDMGTGLLFTGLSPLFIALAVASIPAMVVGPLFYARQQKLFALIFGLIPLVSLVAYCLIYTLNHGAAPIVSGVVPSPDRPVWAFPLFAYLTPQDVMFAAGFVLALVSVACYRAGSKAFWFWLASMCAVFFGAMAFKIQGDFTQVISALETARTKLEREPGSISLANELSAKTRALVLWWMVWGFVGLLVTGFFILSVYLLRRDKAWLTATGAVSLAALTLVLLPGLRVDPPRGEQIVEDAAYRVQIQDGTVTNALFVLIPYSPNDSISEQASTDADKVGVSNRTLSPGSHPTVADIAEEMQLKVSSIYGGGAVRLYNLKNDQGQPIPSPKTPAEAREIAALMWQTYQQGDNYNPVTGRRKLEAAEALMDGMERVEPETRLHLMGTTLNGRDLASRMIHGSRIALYIGFISTGIAVALGILIGGVLGYFAGWVDLIGLRLVEIFASIPVIMLLIMIVAFYGRSLVFMMVVLGLTGWVGYAYFVRAEFLKLRNMDYVMAARAGGTPLRLILFKHMLPNGVAPVLVGASFGIAGAITTEATLSFLGLGLDADQSSWGQMLNQARETGKFAWWLAIYPGMAIFLTVFAYNLIGEALRDVIDPRAGR